jgi:hypothetical protein
MEGMLIFLLEILMQMAELGGQVPQGLVVTYVPSNISLNNIIAFHSNSSSKIRSRIAIVLASE